jgi:hypothetical protein
VIEQQLDEAAASIRAGVLFLSLGRLVLLPGYASFCLKFAKPLLALPPPNAARVVSGGHTLRDQRPEWRLRRRQCLPARRP